MNVRPLVLVVAAITAGCDLGGDGEAEPRQHRLVPEGSRVAQRWPIPADGGMLSQLVHWTRGLDQGLALWERSDSGWKRAAALTLDRGALVGIVRGDLTGDGHAELLADPHIGTGGCGVKRILTADGGDARVLFSRYLCDTSFRFGRGRLVRMSGEYTAHDAHCCPTFTRRTTYRWNGSRLGVVAQHLYWNCIERYCQNWRAGPLHFRPRHAVFWDTRRGIAVGGNKPWLFGRTTDGGKTWTIVDASICELLRPRVGRRGVATVRFAGCVTESGSFTVARTSDYGRTWTAR